jgi:hypothetical protein
MDRYGNPPEGVTAAGIGWFGWWEPVVAAREEDQGLLGITGNRHYSIRHYSPGVPRLACALPPGPPVTAR